MSATAPSTLEGTWALDKLHSTASFAVKHMVVSTFRTTFKDVDATAIKVETLNGTVMLSGFAKSEKERSTAESITRNVNGVKSVKNEIAVRP